jgi:Trypsin
MSVIYLLVGDHDISKGNDTPNAALYATQKAIKHEDYIPESDGQNNDIALLQTKEPIKWKRTIGPACLPFIYEGYNTYFDGYSLVGRKTKRDSLCAVNKC